MADRLPPGTRVRTRSLDPPGHTRLPGYVRGAVGAVVEGAGRHPLPDDRARGRASQPRAVYHVRFAAADLFGSGDHDITVELWEDYLEPLSTEGTHDER